MLLGETCYRISASFDAFTDSRKQSKNTGRQRSAALRTRAGWVHTDRGQG